MARSEANGRARSPAATADPAAAPDPAPAPAPAPAGAKRGLGAADDRIVAAAAAGPAVEVVGGGGPVARASPSAPSTDSPGPRAARREASDCGRTGSDGPVSAYPDDVENDEDVAAPAGACAGALTLPTPGRENDTRAREGGREDAPSESPAGSGAAAAALSSFSRMAERIAWSEPDPEAAGARATADPVPASSANEDRFFTTPNSAPTGAGELEFGEEPTSGVTPRESLLDSGAAPPAAPAPAATSPRAATALLNGLDAPAAYSGSVKVAGPPTEPDG